MEKMENQGCGVNQDLLALWVHGESQDSREKRVTSASQELKERLVLLVLLVHLAAQVMRVTRELLVFRADLDLLGMLVQQALLEQQGPLARLEWAQKETRVRLVKEVYLAWWDPQDLQDIQGQWESQAVTVLLAKMEQRVCQVTLDSRVKRGSQVLLDREGNQVKGEDQDLQEGEDTMPKMHSP